MRTSEDFTNVDGQPKDYADELEAQEKGLMHPVGEFVMLIVTFILTLL